MAGGTLFRHPGLGIVCGNRVMEHHILAGLPVGRHCHIVGVRCLETHYYTFDLIKIATKIQRIIDYCTDLVCRIDEEYGTDTCIIALTRHYHTIEGRDFFAQVHNDRETYLHIFRTIPLYLLFYIAYMELL